MNIALQHEKLLHPNILPKWIKWSSSGIFYWAVMFGPANTGSSPSIHPSITETCSLFSASSRTQKWRRNVKWSYSVNCFISQVVKEYSFLDYIMGGCQINFTVSFGFFGISILLHSSALMFFGAYLLNFSFLDVCRWLLTSRGLTGIQNLLSLCIT